MPEYRVGIGVDAHAFADGVPLVLGGVRFVSARGLAGHSDGDVIAHALIDALLGAAGLGDIGEWFPASDERWRGARSTDLLARVWGSLAEEGWRLENADLTLVASEPRLAPHREAIHASLAAVLGSVSVKATTGEGMGFVGRGEGAAALAVATLG